LDRNLHAIEYHKALRTLKLDDDLIDASVFSQWRKKIKWCIRCPIFTKIWDYNHWSILQVWCFFKTLNLRC